MDKKLVTKSVSEARFWETVAWLNWKVECNKHRPYSIMKKNLMKVLTREEAKEFREIGSYFRSQLYEYLDSRVKGLGDDSFGDFLCHIIGMGKEEYYKCLNSSDYSKETYIKTYRENFFYCIPYDDDYAKASDDYTHFFEWGNKIHRSLQRCYNDDIIRKFFVNDAPIEIMEKFISLVTFFRDFDKTHDYKMFKNSGESVKEDIKAISEYIKKNESKCPHKLFMCNESIWEEIGLFCDMPDDWDDYGGDILIKSWTIENIVNEILEVRKETL